MGGQRHASAAINPRTAILNLRYVGIVQEVRELEWGENENSIVINA